MRNLSESAKWEANHCPASPRLEGAFDTLARSRDAIPGSSAGIRQFEPEVDHAKHEEATTETWAVVVGDGVSPEYHPPIIVFFVV